MEIYIIKDDSGKEYFSTACHVLAVEKKDEISDQVDVPLSICIEDW